MRNSKKIIIPIIIILILLLLAGGVFAYVYMATDILRTDKEMFFKYFAQISAEDGFIDKGIQEFNEKKKQTPYESLGEITAEVQYPDESMDYIIEKVNDLVIRFSGKTDLINQKVEQNIEIDYGNDVIFPINYRQDGNKIGVQTDELSKKIIAVRNENLKEFASKFGIEDVEQIPDQIELSNTIEEFSFTTEEKEQLKQIYGPVFSEQLLDENFSRVKNGQTESYTLELSNEQIKNLIIKILEATKQNTLIIDKINEFLLSQDSDAETIDVSVIDEMIEDINGDDTQNNLTGITDTAEDIIDGINEEDVADIADMSNIKLTLVQTDKQLNQIIIESGESTISIGKNIAENSLSYNIDCVMKETTEGNSLFEEAASTTESNLYFNVQYNGLESLDNIQEKYVFGFDVKEDDGSMKYAYQINTDTQFVESVTVEALDEDVAVFLNDYDETQLTPFLTQVGTKLLDINKNQMAELELKEYENPLLYSNPITLLVTQVFNMAVESVNDVENFTVDVDSENGIVIYEKKENKQFEKSLKSDNIEYFTDISGEWLPPNINNEGEGSHNGRNYIAYTFYVENAGQDTMNYTTTIEIEDVSQNMDEAVRVMVFKNDNNKVIYAKNNMQTGQPEPNTEPFYDEDTVMLEYIEDFNVGDIDKYTVVIWIEGDDSNCTNDLIGGRIKMHMNITEENS